MKRILSLLLALVLLLCLCPVPARAEGAVSDEPVDVSTLTAEDVPAYDGSDYILINDNVPDFYLWQLTTEAYVSFSAFDELERTGAGMACLGPETLCDEERAGVDGSIRPSGWHTVRYDDLIEDHYLYNRSHVIGHRLCGDISTPENLFTGTRFLNNSVMKHFEILVIRHIENTQNHVLYRVTPIYRGDDLVATGVQMEAWSVEDGGEGICFNVFVYNVQPGILIDYSDGSSERDPDYVPPETADDDELLFFFEMGSISAPVPGRSLPGEGSEEARDATSDDAAGGKDFTPNYIVNINTKVFHYPDCTSVRDMKEKNKLGYYGTREDAINDGYHPCGICHP